MDYIAYSIDVPLAGGFYWYIIALQDLLRASEYTGASVVYAIHYYVNGNNSLDNLRNYIVLDALQVSTEDDHWEIGANDFFELENIHLT